MPRVSTPRRNSNVRHRIATSRPTYWNHSREPLQILLFILPLIIAYEIGLILVHGRLGNVAHLTLLRFFEAFGIPPVFALYMGGIAIVVVLLTWHILTGQRWRVRGSVIGIMALESAALAMPLVLIGQVVASVGAGAANPSLAANVAGAGAVEGIGAMGAMGAMGGPWLEPLVISLGAGLYEELLFRMMLIGILHTLLVDVAGASNVVGCVVAIIVSAAAFAWYHTVGLATPMPPRELVFLFIAGLYFGALFLTRGFGIVVGVHAAYDIVVLVFHAP